MNAMESNAMVSTGGLRAAAPKDAPADLILTNGDIYTGDAQHARVAALAIRGEWVVAAGSAGDMRPWRGPKTRMMDLHGQFAMPGFNDAHVHIGGAGQAKLAVDLQGSKSLAELQQRVRERLKDYKAGEWITGRGWDHTLWPQKIFPTGADLDAVSTEHPMIFERVDGHVAVANSLALQMAGITKNTPDPSGGHIVRDARSGEASGMLEEDSAMDLVISNIPPPSAARRRRGIELALEEASRFGVTSVQDNSEWGDFLVYEQLKNEGTLPVRITEWLNFGAPLEQLEEQRGHGGTTDAWLKIGPLKGFLDGSLGSRTAAMLAPYSDDRATNGILRMDPAKVEQMAIARDKAGFQLAFHAIGDRANRVALDAFAAVRAANGPRDRRDRVEHAQILAPDDVSRFAQLDVIVSMQPSHETTDMRWAEDRIGALRAKGAYAWHSLEKSGAHLAFGTDYPVESINPLRGLHACVTRALPGQGPADGWEPQETISMDDCIRGYTVGSAYAQFEEQRKGRLAAGQVADVVVLSADVTSMPPQQILDAHVVTTIVGGRIVYQRK
jgi:predicted amidohydrolase YtcJ